MTSPHGNRYSRLRVEGITLLELLTVLAILSLLGGLSAAAFQAARRNYSLSATASQVETLLLQARNTAIRGGIPVRVIVDPSANTITAFAFESLGEWSFEDTNSEASVTLGLFRDPAEMHGAEFDPDGHVGQCINLNGGFVDCGNVSRFDIRVGLYVEAWIRPHESTPTESRRPTRGTRRRGRAKTPSTPESGGVAVILAKGRAFFLGTRPDGALEGGIGPYHGRTSPGVVVAGVWSKVAMRFEGDAIRLYADGVEHDVIPVGVPGLNRNRRPKPPPSIPLDPGALTIGASTNGFTGRVDEVRVRGMIEPKEYTLGPRQKILGWRKDIWFDGRGHLDARKHERPLRLLLYEEELRDVEPGRTVVAIDFSKTFEQWVEARGMKDNGEVSERSEERRLENALKAALRESIVVDRVGAVR